MVTMNDEYLTARMGKMYMVPSNEADLSLFVWWIKGHKSHKMWFCQWVVLIDWQGQWLHDFFRWLRSFNDIYTYTVYLILMFGTMSIFLRDKSINTTCTKLTMIQSSQESFNQQKLFAQLVATKPSTSSLRWWSKIDFSRTSHVCELMPFGFRLQVCLL